MNKDTFEITTLSALSGFAILGIAWATSIFYILKSNNFIAIFTVIAVVWVFVIVASIIVGDE
jgi:hypothetical protein